MTEELPKIKNPTTYEEQIHILKERGLIIPNEDKAIQLLERVNYYRLSAYALTVKKNDCFFDGITIQNIYNLYDFDRKFRTLLMSVLEIIEIAFRTHIAYLLAHKYGALGYLDQDNFNNTEYHNEFVDRLNNDVNRAHELFIKHHKEKYNGKFPIWVVIEVLSFGDLSKLFFIMKNGDKQKITKEYYKVPHYYVSNWLKLLTVIRNICAHYGRLYNRKINKLPRLTDEDSKFGFDVNRVSAAIFIMKKLCPDKNSWDTFIVNLQALIDQYEEVDCQLLGLPENWMLVLGEYIHSK